MPEPSAISQTASPVKSKKLTVQFSEPLVVHSDCSITTNYNESADDEVSRELKAVRSINQFNSILVSIFASFNAPLKN